MNSYWLVQDSITNPCFKYFTNITLYNIYFSRLNKTTKQLEEEKHINKSLCQNQSEWQTKVAKSQKEMEDANSKKDKEIKELQVITMLK